MARVRYTGSVIGNMLFYSEGKYLSEQIALIFFSIEKVLTLRSKMINPH